MTVSKTIEKIVVLKSNSEGEAEPVVVYRKGRKRKGSPMTRKLGGSLERGLKAQIAMTQDYLSRHKKSSRKKRDGWITDMGGNLKRAMKKGRKCLE